MTLAEDHNALEELATAGADPALGGSALPRTAVGDPNRLGAHGLDELDHGGAEDRVAVEDEVSRRGVVGNASRSCRITHAAVRWNVALK
jgi:hypothetical protein